MKMMNYSVIRGICAVVIGLLLVVWPETAILYLVIAIGALFLIPGLVSIVSYVMNGRKLRMPFPIVSVGSSLFGLWLMISPAFFVGIVMYVLGVVLVFAGISQIITLLNTRSWTPVATGYFVIPVLVLLAGMVVLLNPFAAATIPFIILGVSCMVYGISDIINRIRFRKKDNYQEVVVEEVTPIEEVPDQIEQK